MDVKVGLVALALLFAACGDNSGDVVEPYVEIAAVPATSNRDVDLLFVFDDTQLDFQTAMKNAMPAFLEELGRRDGLPNLHVGVISTDVGTLGTADNVPGAPIGSGPGSCAGVGKDGALQLGTTTGAPFVSDIAASDGTRTTNYSSALATELAARMSLGAAGCGIEQPLHAIRRAFDNPANNGFRRTNANLAIIMLVDEDDCSFSHATLLGSDSALGPLQSFRCTRFGVTCDDDGATPDAMNEIGVKDRCHANNSSPYFEPVADFATSIRALVTNRHQTFVATIGATPSVEVELRTPPGGGIAIPALAHSCTASGPNGVEVADPAVRLAEVTAMFERHAFYGDVCEGTYAETMRGIARSIRQMTGDPCIGRTLPEDCIAVVVTGDVEQPLEGWSVVADPAHCTAEGNLALVLPPVAPDAIVSLRCRL